MSNLDAEAKKRGFPNHAAYLAWHQKYRQKRRTGDAGTIPGKRRNSVAETNPGKYSNVFERIAAHPAGILRRVSNKLNEVNSR